MTEDTYTGNPNDPLSLNLYSYCHNEPLMYTDPTGHAEAKLRDRVNATNGQITLTSTSAIITVNGVKQEFKYSGGDGYKNVNGSIVLDSSKFDSTFSYKAGKTTSSISTKVTNEKISSTITTVSVNTGHTVFPYLTTTKNTGTSANNLAAVYAPVAPNPLITNKSSTNVTNSSVPATKGTGNSATTIGSATSSNKVSTNNINPISWVQEKLNQYKQWGDELEAKNSLDMARSFLEIKGVDPSSPEYTQQLIEEAIKQKELNDIAMDMVTGLYGGIEKVGSTAVKSLIKNDTKLIKAAEKMGSKEAVQKEANELVTKFISGNTNPGIGTKNLFKDICYLRGSEGARVFYRMTENGMEILAKSSKANEQFVINVLKELYK